MISCSGSFGFFHKIPTRFAIDFVRFSRFTKSILRVKFLKYPQDAMRASSR